MMMMKKKKKKKKKKKNCKTLHKAWARKNNNNVLYVLRGFRMKEEKNRKLCLLFKIRTYLKNVWFQIGI